MVVQIPGPVILSIEVIVEVGPHCSAVADTVGILFPSVVHSNMSTERGFRRSCRECGEKDEGGIVKMLGSESTKAGSSRELPAFVVLRTFTDERGLPLSSV